MRGPASAAASTLSNLAQLQSDLISSSLTQCLIACLRAGDCWFVVVVAAADADAVGVKVNTVAVKFSAEEIRLNGLTNYRLDAISSSLTN